MHAGAAGAHVRAQADVWLADADTCEERRMAATLMRMLRFDPAGEYGCLWEIDAHELLTVEECRAQAYAVLPPGTCYELRVGYGPGRKRVAVAWYYGPMLQRPLPRFPYTGMNVERDVVERGCTPEEECYG